MDGGTTGLAWTGRALMVALWVLGWTAPAMATAASTPGDGGAVTVIVGEAGGGARETATGSAGERGGAIRRSDGAMRAGSSDVAAAGEDRSGGGVEVLRLLAGLGLVVGLILALKYGASKWLGVRGWSAGENRGIRVLSRTLMGPRQQLVLVQVGRKLVLLSDSAGQVTSVTEVTDPDEVAELAAQAMGRSAEADGPSASGFAQLLGLKSMALAGAVSRDGEEPEPAGLVGRGVRDDGVDDDASATADRAELSAGAHLDELTQRVRGLSARLGVASAPAGTGGGG
ncbi:MAG: FliO/MopB family protein [Tepidisphaerales bacterium]